MWTKHFAADLSRSGEAHPGETALLVKGDHWPALCFFTLKQQYILHGTESSWKDSHVVYADGKC